MDAIVGGQLIIEKGLDSRSRGALAQVDIAGYYANIPLARLSQKLLQMGFSLAWTGAAIRAHVRPKVELHVRTEMRPLPQNTRGLRTGAESSNPLGRIPVEDTVLARIHTWEPLAHGHRQRSVDESVDRATPGKFHI